jgi:hypothetical protein
LDVLFDDGVEIAVPTRGLQRLELREGAVVVLLGEVGDGALRAARAAVVAAREHLEARLVGVLRDGALVPFDGVGLADARLQHGDDAQLDGAHRRRIARLKERIHLLFELDVHLPDGPVGLDGFGLPLARERVDLGPLDGRGGGRPRGEQNEGDRGERSRHDTS